MKPDETPNPADIVGRTFEKDGERCRILFVHLANATVRWCRENGAEWAQVPEAMLAAWLEGAVEVKEKEA